MGKRRRQQPERAIHHVMNRGVDRAPIFFADADRVEFGRRLGDYLGFPTENARYCALSRARKRAQDNPVVASVLRRIA